MKALVTGCAGFIGSVVTRQLLDAGHEVVGVDEINDAYDPRLKEYRMKGLLGRDGFRFHRVDIRVRGVLDSLLEGVDVVFNLAARAGVRASMVDPWVYVDTNTTGTLNVLEAARTHDVGRIVLASTSSLYGAHNQRPFREDADTSRPLSPYAASKGAAESMCAAYTHLYGIHTPVLRYFTVYGPAGRPDMSVFRFMRWIAEGRPLRLYGDGSFERDFTFVEDIARGTIAAAGVDGHEIVNLGNDRPARMIDMIHILEELIGREAHIDHQPVHAADVPATWADISKASTLLGWRPSTRLRDGLAQTWAWYQDNQELATSVRL